MNTHSPNPIHRPCPDIAGFVMSSDKKKHAQIKVCELRLFLLRDKYKNEQREYVRKDIEKQAYELTTKLSALREGL
ncbi:hypothetical protein HC723_07505 [Vibrio sp. S11_S32]|uniref:hypothetical protein n=1 Tax=Vibrio sp. S11_S32 TaxID=2720225 RepID=UPI001680735F|nr:hypothetical protein [Vibrio sp. S11_S32]MBD1576279.1 hypothetical protein [Vibrio sp. S11_S32]